MKKFIRNKYSMLFAITTTFFSCAGDDSTLQDPIDNSGSIEIKALQITSITETTVIVTSSLVSNGNNQISAIGVCLSTSPSPTINATKVSAPVTTGNFECNLKDLISNTKYYIRAYVSSKLGTIYSNEMSFTTTKAIVDIPTVTTGNISSLTSTSVRVNTLYENIDKKIIVSAGIYLSTNSNLTSTDARTTALLDENYNTKKFTVNVNKLAVNTKYYARGFVETVFGTYLGNTVSFVTKEAGVPTVSTYGVSSVSKNVIEISARLESDGGAEITKYGFCLANFDTNPTLETNFATITTNSGIPDAYFKNRIEDFFTSGVYYYGRVYAVNKYGVGYGAVIKFTVN